MAKSGKELIDTPLITQRDGVITIKADRLKAADELLHKQMEYEQQVVVSGGPVGETLPWDGAIALEEVARTRWGAALMAPGGSEPMVQCDVDKSRKVQWGRYFIPGAEHMVNGDACNFIQCDVDRTSDGRYIFKLVAKVQRKWNQEYAEIAEQVLAYANDNSIYKGKAIQVKLFDSESKRLPFPDIKFMDVRNVELGDIVFERTLASSVEDNILTPIRYGAACTQLGAPRRRGVLLWGRPGVGKTMLAAILARVATQEAGMTYILGQASEFEHLMGLALQLQGTKGVVLFAEDIDRIVKGAERTERVDRILNIVDGVNTKSSRVFIVLTTNDLGAIREEMLREGRLDVTLHLTPPDAEAITRLIKVYGRGLVDPDANLMEAGAVLAGTVPATVREVLERAKFSAIRRLKGDISGGVVLNAEDILRASHSVMRQRKDIQQSRPPVVQHPYVEAADRIAKAVREADKPERTYYSGLPRPSRLQTEAHEPGDRTIYDLDDDGEPFDDDPN